MCNLMCMTTRFDSSLKDKCNGIAEEVIQTCFETKNLSGKVKNFKRI